MGKAGPGVSGGPGGLPGGWPAKPEKRPKKPKKWNFAQTMLFSEEMAKNPKRGRFGENEKSGQINRRLVTPRKGKNIFRVRKPIECYYSYRY